MRGASTFDPWALERRYVFVDRVPEALLSRLIGLDLGTLEERATGLGAWRTALLEGREPPSNWPAPEIGGPVRNTLRRLGLGRFFVGQEELVDAFLGDALAAFARREEDLAEEIAESLRELEQLEMMRAHEEEEVRAKRERRRPRRVEVPPLDDAQRAEGERDARERMRRMLDGALEEELVSGWADEVRAWSEIAEVFGDLGELFGRGWDLTQGVLRHVGWRELLRLRELVEKLPELRDVIRALGRLEAARDDEHSIAETIFGPVRRLEEERREVRSPFVPGETRGVERSGELSRMLPSEAALLGHPRLSRLWHARRAERALLTYRHEGLDWETALTERETTTGREVRRPKLERGPILAVIDTSGSMHGAPEQVAKALVLETVRTAHRERRRCLVYLYSGPGQIRELELDLSPTGVGSLLDFLGLTFGGGSDEVGVLERLLGRLESEGWSKADVLFASDGEWPAPSSVVDRVSAARARGARFHGVQIGRRGRTGLHAFCEPVHEFSEWASLAGW